MSQAFGALGLTIEVLSGPSGTTPKPRVGQSVALSYTGRLNDSAGTVFDSNESKEPLTVRVGRGQVISGLDAALPYVACGQRVRITIPPALAYGSKGKAGAVPPNQRLCFEMTLVRIDPDSPNDSLLEAASMGDETWLGRDLLTGADVGHADRKGATALHLAAAGGHLECVVRLLEARANVDAVQSAPAGVTALMHAVKSSAEPLCAQLLLVARADAARQSAKGNSALSLMRADSAYASIIPVWEALQATKAANEPPPLGIGVPMPAGWEPLRTHALWLSQRRRANPRCWLRFAVDPATGPPTAAGPLVEVELYADVVPRTAENFRCLCTGEKGKCAAFGSPPLHFKGNVSHRIVPGNILQAGDITSGDGKGGESIYGRKFDDESFVGRAGRHKSKGLLSMANSGRNSNGSQFFITLDAMPHLDGKHVVFGRVLKGMEYVEAIVGAVGTATGVPSRRVVIADCGEMATA